MASDIGRLPTVVSGSETTYECDSCWFNNGITAVALFGGGRSYGSRCGLSYWSVYNPATSVYTNFVARPTTIKTVRNVVAQGQSDKLTENDRQKSLRNKNELSELKS